LYPTFVFSQITDMTLDIKKGNANKHVVIKQSINLVVTAQSTNLTIESGNKYVVTTKFLVIDTLIMEDNSTLELQSDTTYLIIHNAYISHDCRIDASSTEYLNIYINPHTLSSLYVNLDRNKVSNYYLNPFNYTTEENRKLIRKINVIPPLYTIVRPKHPRSKVIIGKRGIAKYSPDDIHKKMNPDIFSYEVCNDIGSSLYPPPIASAVVPDIPLISRTSSKMSDIDLMLTKALYSCGYRELKYYTIPKGFAIVTGIEQIDNEGRPLPEPDRWSSQTKFIDKFSLTEYVKALFKADKGYFRIIVFIVTSDNISFSDNKITKNTARSWFNSGNFRLSKRLKSAVYTRKHTLNAFIYEFEVNENNNEPVLSLPSPNRGEKHLKQTNIWQALNLK